MGAVDKAAADCVGGSHLHAFSSTGIRTEAQGAEKATSIHIKNLTVNLGGGEAGGPIEVVVVTYIAYNTFVGCVAL